MKRRGFFGFGLGALLAPVLPALAKSALASGGAVQANGFSIIGEAAAESIIPLKPVTSSLIVEGSITSEKIFHGAITASKIYFGKHDGRPLRGMAFPSDELADAVVETVPVIETPQAPALTV